YKSLNEALKHAGIHTSSRVNIHYVDSEELEKGPGVGGLEKMDAILVPGGFGKRGTEGKIRAIRYARENGIPYLGICLGMQLATMNSPATWWLWAERTAPNSTRTRRTR